MKEAIRMSQREGEKIKAELPVNEEKIGALEELSVKESEGIKQTPELQAKIASTHEALLNTFKNEATSNKPRKVNGLKNPDAGLPIKIYQREKPSIAQSIKNKASQVLEYFNRNNRKIAVGLSFLTLGLGAEGANNNAEKIFSDSTSNKTEDPLKPGEKFRLLPERMELAGITMEGRLLVPTKDTTKEVYLIKFSGNGKNQIGKELEALSALGLKPASEKYLSEINDEAFRASGSSIKVIDVFSKEGENIGQPSNVIAKENTVIYIRNPLRVQTAEVEKIDTFEYATVAYKDKVTTTASIGQDVASGK